MRRQLLTIVLVSLIILSLSPDYYVPHAQKPLYTLVGHYMCLDYNLANNDPVEIKNGFFTLDKQIICWIRINFSTNVYIHGYFLKWYDPTGELYQTYDVLHPVGPGTVTLMDNINSYHAPTNMLKQGIWTVIATLNGTALFTDYFTVGDYMITIGVSGIPAIHSTSVRLNNTYVGRIQGGQLKKFTLTKSPSTVSVDKYANVTSEIRYVCSQNLWSNPADGTSYTFSYMLQYYLTVKSPYGTPKGSGWYNNKTLASFNVTSVVDHGNGTRRLFNGWTDNLSTSAVSASIYMTEPKTVTATWKRQYYLTVISAYESPKGSGWYDDSATASFNATPTIVNHGNGTRRIFLGWKGDVDSSATSGTVLMNSPKTINVIWKKMYYLAVNSTYGTANGTGWYDSDAEAKFSVSPTTVQAPGILGIFGGQMEFKGWQGDSNPTAASGTIIINGPKSVTAVWNANFVQSYVILGVILVAVIAVALYVLRKRMKKVVQLPPKPTTVIFPSPLGSQSSTQPQYAGGY